MEPAVGALQYTWSHPDQDTQCPQRDDYFVELVERVTAVTPEIDRAVGQSVRQHHATSDDALRPHPSDPADEP